MKKSKVIGLSAYTKQIEKDLMKLCVDNITEYLIGYATDTIRKLGERIGSYNSRNNMDDTGNLLDSLCWGVYYKGEVKQTGFYRPQKATEKSYMHAWSRAHFKEKYGLLKGQWAGGGLDKGIDASEDVYGHRFAEEFLNSYKSKYTKGWQVFFAILAPYWGYWESGFVQKDPHGFGTARAYHKFAVMTELYDDVKKDLGVQPHLTVADIRYTSFKLKRNAERNYY